MDTQVMDSSNSASFIIVPDDLTQFYLEQAQHLIKTLVKKFSKELTIDHINKKILSGDYTMIAIIDECEIRYMMLTNVFTFPTGYKILNVPHSMGRNPFAYADQIMAGIMKVAKATGCSQIRGKGVRPGFAKVLENYGWKTHRPSMIIEVT